MYMIVDYLYLFIYKLFSLLTKIIPSMIMNGFFKLLAYAAYYLHGKYRRIALTNLDFAFQNMLSEEEKKNIILRVYYNLVQTVTGFMKRSGMDKETLLVNIHFKNEHYLLQAIENKEKIIFITGHYSNWELLPPAITSKYGITLVGIGRKLDSDTMDKVLLRNREQFGVEMLYRKGGMKGAIKALRQNKTVGFLMDQSLGEKQGGIKVDFFGKSVGHSPAASVLARNLGAIMIPAFISTDDYKHYTVTFYKPIAPVKTDNKEADILTMTQAQASITEQVIREKPQEWFWVHKRWKVYYPELYKQSTS